MDQAALQLAAGVKLTIEPVDHGADAFAFGGFHFAIVVSQFTDQVIHQAIVDHFAHDRHFMGQIRHERIAQNVGSLSVQDGGDAADQFIGTVAFADILFEIGAQGWRAAFAGGCLCGCL